MWKAMPNIHLDSFANQVKFPGAYIRKACWNMTCFAFQIQPNCKFSLHWFGIDVPCIQTFSHELFQNRGNLAHRLLTSWRFVHCWSPAATWSIAFYCNVGISLLIVRNRRIALKCTMQSPTPLRWKIILSDIQTLNHCLRMSSQKSKQANQKSDCTYQQTKVKKLSITLVQH